MKKRVIGSISILVVVLILLGAGLWLALRKTAEVETGNELDVAWYDVSGEEFTLTTADQFYEFAALSDFYDFKGQTIKLGADIVINEGNAEEWADAAPSRKWSPISQFAGTFDGQGHTISGLYATGFDTQVALFANAKSSCVIRNFKLTNSYIKTKGYGGTASIISSGGGTFQKIYSDAIIDCSGDFCGGIASKLILNSTISECWYDGKINISGRTGGGILDTTEGSSVTMEHCLYSGIIESTWDYSGARVGGLCAMVNQQGATLTLKDSLSSGKITTANAYYVGTALGVVYANTALEAEDVYGSMSVYDVIIGRSGEAGTFRGAPLDIRAEDLIGDKAYTWTGLDFDKYWTTVTDDTPILQCFADEVQSVAGIEKAYDLSWYDASKSEFVITNLKELYGFRMISMRTDFKGKTVKLGANIAVNEGNAADWGKNSENVPANPWYPLGKFDGTFDGQGYAISGIYVKNASQQLGFFKETAMNSVVKNFNLKNSYFEYTGTSNSLMGSIAGRGNGTFDTIYSNAIVVSSGAANGGLIGQINNDQTKNIITNCWFDGTVALKNGGRYGGGIVSNVVKGATEITHCLNTGTISSDYEKGGVFASGIVAVTMNEGTFATVDDCLSVGKIDVVYHVCVGTVFGRVQNGTQVSITNTYSTTESYQHPTNGFMGVGTQSVAYKGGVADYYKADISGYGGYQKTTLDFNNYWAVDRQSTPILKSFASSVPSLSGVKKLVNIDWYDEDAKSYTINTAEELNGLYIVSALSTLEGKTVRLGKDIVLNSGNAADWAANAPESKWNPLKKFSGTFDGQGHTISGMYVNVDYGYAGMFIRITESGVVKNFRLTNSYITSDIDGIASLGSIAGEFGGTMDGVYSSAIVESNGTQFGGMIGRVNSLENSFRAKYKITNCWFDGEVRGDAKVAAMTYIGGIAGALIQGTLNMDNCLNTGTVIYMYDELPLMANGNVQAIGVHVGGLLGGVMNGLRYNDAGEITRISEWNLSDSLGAGAIISGLKDGSRDANGAGSILGYTTSGTVHVKNVYATAESSLRINNRSMHYNATSATVTGSVIVYAKDTLAGLGGYKYTVLDFQNYWAARSAEVPALKKFAGNGLSLANAWRLDTSWYDDSKDSFTISTVGQLYGFASLVNEGKTFEGKTVSLDANIDVNVGWTAGEGEPENIWSPIGSKPTNGNAFKGTFNGNKKTIRGIYINETGSTAVGNVGTAAGLFGYTVNCTIMDLTLENSYMNSTSGVLGGIIGYGEGDLINIYVKEDVTLNFKGSQVGGLIGRIQDGSVLSGTAAQKSAATCNIINCWFAGTINSEGTNSTARAGGLVGYSVWGNHTIQHSLFTGTIHVNGGNYFGGLIADSNGSGNTEITITDCLSAGIIDGTGSYIGSIAGRSNGDALTLTQLTVGEKATVVNSVFATEECNAKVAGTDANSRVSIIPVKAETLYGTDGYLNTWLDFDTYWSARDGKVPALTTFVGDGLDVSGLEREVPEENDSWYDEAKDSFVISTVEELYELARLVNEDGVTFAGKTITLGDNIDVNEGWKASATAPENKWTPIGTSSKAFQGIFDGDGKTISGIYVNVSGGYAGLFGNCGAGSIVKDVRVENSYIVNNTSGNNTAAVVAYFAGVRVEGVYSDAYVSSPANNVGGLIGGLYATNGATLENSWFAGTVYSNGSALYVGGLVGRVSTGANFINNCLNTGSVTNLYADSSNLSYTGGLFGGMSGTAKTLSATLRNCVTTGRVEVRATGAVGSVSGRVRNTLTIENVYTTDNIANVDGNTILTQSTVTGVGNYSTNSNTVNGSPEKVDFNIAEVLTATLTALNEKATAEGWCEWVEEDGIPVLGTLSSSSWYDPAKDSYELNTAKDLYKLAQLVNEDGITFAGKTITLGANIDFNKGWTAGAIAPENPWTPIGTSSKAFQGIFDGNGKTIRGIYVNVSGGYAGFFGNCGEGSVVKNVRVENSYIVNNTSGNNTAAVVAYFAGIRVEGVYSDAYVSSPANNVGGLIGGLYATNGATLENSWFAGTVYSNGSALYVGGLVGRVSTGANFINNCLNTGSVTNLYADGSGLSYTGGLFGGMSGTAKTLTATLRNCVTTGRVEVKATGAVGSVSGRVRNTLTIENVYTTDNIANVDGKAILTQSTVTGVGNYSTNSNTVNGSPEKVDFSVAEVLTTTLAALNERAAKDNWGSWISKDGVPVLEQLVKEDEVNKTALARESLLNIFVIMADKNEAANEEVAVNNVLQAPTETSKNEVPLNIWAVSEYFLIPESFQKILGR